MSEGSPAFFPSMSSFDTANKTVTTAARYSYDHYCRQCPRCRFHTFYLWSVFGEVYWECLRCKYNVK